MADRSDCYGAMFPDLNRLDYNRPVAGAAFEVLVESRGIGVASRQVRVRTEGWAKCRACPEYRDCYDLSMAKLTLGAALEMRT